MNDELNLQSLAENCDNPKLTSGTMVHTCARKHLNPECSPQMSMSQVTYVYWSKGHAQQVQAGGDADVLPGGASDAGASSDDEEENENEESDEDSSSDSDLEDEPRCASKSLPAHLCCVGGNCQGGEGFDGLQ